MRSVSWPRWRNGKPRGGGKPRGSRQHTLVVRTAPTPITRRPNGQHNALRAHRRAFAPPPQIWSAELVKARLVEAFDVDRRLPGRAMPRMVQNAWPFPVMHSFADLVSQDTRGDAWRRMGRVRGAASWEVSRMEEAFGWLQDLVREPDRGALIAWCRRPHSIALDRLLQRQGISRATFYRRAGRGLEAMVEALNRRKVPVR